MRCRPFFRGFIGRHCACPFRAKSRCNDRFRLLFGFCWGTLLPVEGQSVRRTDRRRAAGRREEEEKEEGQDPFGLDRLCRPPALASRGCGRDRDAWSGRASQTHRTGHPPAGRGLLKCCAAERSGELASPRCEYLSRRLAAREFFG